MAKCPHCERAINSAKIKTIDLNAGLGGNALRGVAYSCPQAACQKIISIQMDPIALNTDLRNDIKRG